MTRRTPYQQAVKTKVDEAVKRMSRRIGYVSAPDFLSAASVDFWLNQDILQSDVEQYPNAKKAAELKKTKLYKAMK